MLGVALAFILLDKPTAISFDDSHAHWRPNKIAPDGTPFHVHFFAIDPTNVNDFDENGGLVRFHIFATGPLVGSAFD